MLRLFSNPEVAQQNAYKYLGADAVLFKSTRKGKKYMIYDKFNNKFVHFGQFGVMDFTKHGNLNKKMNYLNRSGGIKGNWKENPYSANNLSRNILWK